MKVIQIEHIPTEHREQVERYIRETFPEQAELMMLIADAWWGDYNLVGYGRWSYWWRDAAVEMLCSDLAGQLGLSAVQVDRGMLALAKTGAVGVEVRHDIRHAGFAQRCYAVSPAQSAVLLGIGIADEDSHRSHTELVEQVKVMVRAVRQLLGEE